MGGPGFEKEYHCSIAIMNMFLLYFSGWLSMAFGNSQWLRVYHTKPSTLGWSVVVGLYKLMTQPFPKAMDNQPEKYSMLGLREADRG